MKNVVRLNDGKRGSDGQAVTRWHDRVPTLAEQRGLKEEAILECAAGWFHRHGFHGTSLSDLAGELGVTKAALYHYAKNKEELLYRLHLRSLAATKASRDRVFEEGGTGMDRLYRLIYNFVLIMTGSPTESFILLEPGTLDDKRSREVIKQRRWLEHDLRDLVSAGINDGSIVPCDPKLVTFIIVGAQNWISTWYRSGFAWSGEQVATGFATMMRRMLSTERSVDVPTDLASVIPQPVPVRARGRRA